MRLVAFIVPIALGAATAAPAAEIPGRLFYTPGQRAMLDVARKQNVRIDLGGDEQEAAPGPQEVTVNGIIRGSDGKSTVWINHRMVGGKAATPGVEVRPRGDASGVTLALPQSSRSVDLKVGQTIDVNTGAVAEPYRRRSPPPPAEKPASKPPADGKTAEKVTPSAPAQAAQSGNMSAPARATDRRRGGSDDLPPSEGLELNRNEKPPDN